MLSPFASLQILYFVFSLKILQMFDILQGFMDFLYSFFSVTKTCLDFEIVNGDAPFLFLQNFSELRPIRYSTAWWIFCTLFLYNRFFKCNVLQCLMDILYSVFILQFFSSLLFSVSFLKWINNYFASCLHAKINGTEVLCIIVFSKDF